MIGNAANLSCKKSFGKISFFLFLESLIKLLEGYGYVVSFAVLSLVRAFKSKSIINPPRVPQWELLLTPGGLWIRCKFCSVKFSKRLQFIECSKPSKSWADRSQQKKLPKTG